MPGYQGRSILITGGTGSVGVVLADALVKSGAREVRLFSNDENGLFESRHIFRNASQVRYVLGDVRDPRSLDGAVAGIDIVFHAAALKHLNFCEDNPYEAITTNVVGTQNAINASSKSGVNKFIYVSTDKAANPVSTMGATKLLGEKLTVDAGMKSAKCIFACVRFGNILGSRGSVIKVFQKNVQGGGPLTVTNPNMTRFIMLPSEAKKLVLLAASDAKTGEIFVLKMKAMRIGDLAKAAKEFYARKYSMNASRIGFKTVGEREGEKLHEELMTGEEAKRAVEKKDYFVIRNQLNRAADSHARNSYASNDAELLGVRPLLALLEELDAEISTGSLP